MYKIDEDFTVDEDCEHEDSTVQLKEDKGNRAKAFRIALYLLTKKVSDFYLAGPYLNLNNLKSGLHKYIKNNNITIKQIDFEPTMRIEIDAWKKGVIQNHPILGKNHVRMLF